MEKRLKNSKEFLTPTRLPYLVTQKIGLLWGLYPREMSLIGDRIISKYIQIHFSNEIAYTDEATVNYRYSAISPEKVASFKKWYRSNYNLNSERFKARFGFDVLI